MDHHFNQYDLVLTAAGYLRKNATCPAGKQLKGCKTQQELFEKFSEIENLYKNPQKD